MTKTVRSIVRLFWGLTAAALILLAVTVQLGRSGSFLVADYRQDLADYWSERLQLQVDIGSLQLQWQGLRPEFIASDVRADTLQGARVAAFDSTNVTILLLPSILQLRPVVAELKVKGVELDFQQDEEGLWSLEGLSRTPSHEAKPARQTGGNPFDAFLFGRLVKLSEVQLEFNFRNGQQVLLQVPEISLENSRDFHRLAMRMDIGGRKDMVTLVVEGEGDPRDQDDFISRGYLRILQLPTDKLLSAASKKWLDQRDLELNEGGDVDLELWLDGDGDGFQLQGRLEARKLPALMPEAKGFERLAANIQGHWRRAGDWRLALLDTEIQGQELLQLDLQLLSAGFDEPMQIAIERLPLQALSRLALAQLPADGKLSALLGKLNSRGDLRDVAISVPLDKPKDFQFSAQLDQVAVDALGGAPALTQVDGYVQADISGGLVELDSRNGFSMQYGIYADAMAYDTAYGAVAWHLRPDDNAIYVNSSQLSLRGEDGAAEGFLYLDMPWVQGSRASELTLQIGLQNSKAQYHSKYVPEVVPPTLHQWLDDSIGEGAIDWAGFIYRGSLRPGDSEGRTVQVAVDMQGAGLDYHPRWPQLNNIDGLLLIDDTDVNVDVASAQLHDSTLTNTLVAVTPNTVGSGLLLGVKSQLQGPASDGLRVLRESMLRDTLGEGFDSWNLIGNMSTDLTLSIPLTPGQPGAKQKVDVALSDASLQMAALELNFDQLNGLIRFDERNGLRAKQLKGRLFQRPFSASIDSDLKQKTTRIQASGSAETRALANWSKRPELMFLDGDFPYRADLKLTHGEGSASSTQLNIESSLMGAAVQLPAPFGKRRDEERSLKVAIDMTENRHDYDIQYADQVHFLMQHSVGEDVEQMALGFNQPAVLPGERVFDVAGEVSEMDFGAWKQTLQLYQTYAEALRLKAAESAGSSAEDVSSSDFSPLAIAVDAQISRFILADFSLENLTAKGAYQDERWAFDLENQTLKGRLLAHDDARPLQLELEYLHFADNSSAQTAEEGSQPEDIDLLLNVDPTDLPALDFSTDELKIAGDDYGHWRFAMRPSKDGVSFSEVYGRIKGVTVDGGEGKGAALSWYGQGGDTYSRFTGVLASEDLSASLAEFNQPGLIESETARFNADLGWRGSPAAIGLNQLKGQLDLDIRKGSFPRAEDSGNNPLLRLLGLLNFDTLLRRLQLDFSDMYKTGMVFDSIKGEMQFAEGNLYLQQPLKVRTPSSRLQMAGSIDLENETLDATLVAALPVSSPLALLAALTAGLPVAAGVYLAGKIFEEQVDKLTSVSYRIEGEWDNPEIKFNRIFDAKAAKRTGQKAADKAGTENSESSAEPSDKSL